jgi:hypothetical protein
MSQNQILISYLTPPGRTITTYQAFIKFGITRLASRMNEIKKTRSVRKELVCNKKTKVHYIKYSFS